MGDTVWLEVNGAHGKSGGDRDNSIMLRLEAELDLLADELGVKRLSSFYDHSAMASDFADEFEQEAPDVAETWFDSAEGHRTFEALLKALRERPERLGLAQDRSRAHWQEQLLGELDYCLRAVSDARDQKKQFHLLMVS